MKKQNLFIFLTFFWISSSFAQWTWLNPLPQGNSLYDIQFVNSTTGFAVGDGGTVLKTTDAGATWTRLNTGTLHDLRSVCFVNESIGYVGGYSTKFSPTGTIIKTIDGGTTWTLAPQLCYWGDVYSVYFTSADTGYAGGYYSHCMKTTDGGVTWFDLSNPPGTLWDVYFSDSNTGFILNYNECFKTNDAGATWSTYTFTGFSAQSICFTGTDTGYIAGTSGNGGRIYKTTDRGGSWTQLPGTTSFWLFDIFFYNDSVGYAVGDSGIIIKTSDGGNTWTILNSGLSTRLFAVGCSDINNVMIGGVNGKMIHSMDAGMTWQVLSSEVTNNYLSGCFFTNSVTGFVVGEKGIILKTEDSGLSWDHIFSNTEKWLQDIFFPSPNTGYIVGEDGVILKTLNAGYSWFPLFSPTFYDIYQVVFPDSLTGYVIDVNADIFKTSDGGNSWTLLQIPSAVWPNSIYFIDSDLGFVAGDFGKLIKTTDGGQTWNYLITETTSYLSDVYYLNENTGFISGGGIRKTTDGGLSWQLKDSNVFARRFHFIDALNGYAESGFNILKTTDGGENWTVNPVNLTSYRFWDPFFTSSDTGFLVGENGIILKTTNGGVISSNSNFEKTFNSKMIKIFPNPSNGYFIIRIPYHYVSWNLEIYSAIGKKLLKKELHSDEELVIINDLQLPPSIYFIIVRNDKAIYTGKIIIE